MFSGSRTKSSMVVVAASILFVFLAFDGRLHWDEPGYLYTGGFLDGESILAGEFQPSGIEGFYLSRLFHILLVHAVVGLLGPGMLALGAVIVVYLLCLLGFSYLAYLILQQLFGADCRPGSAVALGAFTPVFLYFAFKTLPEIPALAFSALASFALLKAMKGHALRWLIITSLSLATLAFFKNSMALLYVSMVICLFIFKPRQYPRLKLVSFTMASGIASLALFAGVLLALGIDWRSYFAVGVRLLGRQEPLVATVLNVGLEGGLFFLAIPLAFLSRRREALFFASWFVLATLPLPVIVEHIESRYLATNLIPLWGLVYLAIAGLRPRIVEWWRDHRLMTAGGAGLAVVALLATNAIALSVMAHEVRMDQLHALLGHLDETYGSDDYVILVPYAYTDFHYLRFVYPERNVYSVQTDTQNFTAEDWHAFQNRFYRDRFIPAPAELAVVKRPLVYLGFRENHAVANLRSLVSMVPLAILNRQFDKRSFLDHLELSWMWQHPGLLFSEPVRQGHYFAYPVRIDPQPDGAGRPADARAASGS